MRCRLGRAEPHRARGGGGGALWPCSAYIHQSGSPEVTQPTLHSAPRAGSTLNPVGGLRAVRQSVGESRGQTRGTLDKHPVKQRQTQSPQRWLKISPDSFPLISFWVSVALRLLSKSILSIYLPGAWSWVEGAEGPR